jgi:hypothetical protein
MMHDRKVRCAVALALLAGAAGCRGLLDVSNPNNVNSTALDNPSAAAAEVNGEVAALVRALEQVVGDIETASDNIQWSGSLDGMNDLNKGNVRNPYNEFTENSMFGMTPARFTANQAVQKLTGFQTANVLKDAKQLALANLYDAITYIYIADNWDDFVIDGGGPNVGPANMVTLYDSAAAALGRALPIAQSVGDKTLQGQIYAWQARAAFDREIWKKLNPSGTVPTQPLVSSAVAATAAANALAQLGAGDYKMQLLQTSTALAFGNCSFASCFNSRQEIRFAPAVASYSSTTKVLTVNLKDPIDNIPDPVIAMWASEFVAGSTLSPINITGSRDMLLILAENALASNDLPGFTTNINKIRAFNGLTPYSGQIPAQTLLIYERRVNLFLQARRLADLYRFGLKSVYWTTDSHAYTCPGSFFPITITERQTNPNVTLLPACGQ